PTSERHEQLEIAARRSVRECDFEAIVAPRDLHLMRRRVRITEAGGTIDLHVETARRVLTTLVADVAEAPGVAGAVEQLRVLEGDLASLPGTNGEHTRANQSLARQLDQRRIALLTHDRLVDRPRLRGIHRLAAQLLVALPQRITREHRFAWTREVIHPLAHGGAVVPEPLF